MTNIPEVTVDNIYDALMDVIDPELGVNVVDLGLVYDVKLNKSNVELDMTLTTPACPLSDVIEEQVRAVLPDLTVSINWVWEPEWSMDRITDLGKDQLRSVGFNIQ